MIDLYQIAPLLSLIDAFRVATGVTDATISTRLFNDGKKVAQLRAGGGLTLHSAARAVEWLSANWPGGRPWPVDVPRPGISRLAVVQIAHSNTPPASSPGVPAETSSAGAPAGAGDIAPAGGEESRMEAAE